MNWKPSDAYTTFDDYLIDSRIDDPVQRNPPDTLYHYTNAAGLCGILDSNRFWATHYRFLNDSSEINYGMSILREVGEELLRGNDSPAVEDMLLKTVDSGGLFEAGLEAYVTCFCATDDLLNQWRVYASGGGYSIGVNARRWRDILTRHGNTAEQTFLIYKMEYDVERQRELIRRVLSHAVDSLRSHIDNMPVEDHVFAIARCCQFISTHTLELLLTFKHPQFSVEEEWRLVRLENRSEEHGLQFRNGLYGLTPYVVIDPTVRAGVDANKIPITSVRHGPAPNPENSKFAVSQLLRKHNRAFIDVLGSTLPIRVV